MLDYNKIKYYYDNGLWDEYRVNKSVQYNKITEQEYKQITGNDYVPM